eukprot:CAMPEP_0172330476 /NCGR_PEP_ID=MMETSP1058-20130122/61423_1 /TAXON_ID=83371 /ORGANISM="Detonula confervacea, Strain CCMP 353" /LENGTH=1301 /DNA_ID=CAMNT_0013047691 /DNA_START=56 /DNA_END=3961 /DNA_ORIENTATION=-
MTTVPRSEDLISGGGTFSSCLTRAIRHPILAHNAAAAAGVGVAGGEPASLADAISRSTSSDSVNQDSTNNNSGYVTTTPDRRKSLTANDDNANSFDNDLAQEYLDREDWSTHHISHPLLRSTLNFFSQRRAGLRARLRNVASNNEPLATTNAAIICSEGKNSTNKPTLSEEEFNLQVGEWAMQAPFLKKEEDGDGSGGGSTGTSSGGGGGGSGGDNNLMEYAGQRALGRTPPGGRIKKQRKKNTNTNNDDEEDLTVADVLVSAACANAIPMGNEDENGPDSACSPYLRMGGSSTSNSLLNEAEITARLSFMERSELSAVLDSEVERAARYYRLRISELAPPRVDGGTCPTFAGCGGLEFEIPHDLYGGGDAERQQQQQAEDHASLSNNDGDELIAPSQDLPPLSFTDMASEILELHAFITTNIIVVRQVLIKYDAFVRSLGGTPMGSWYQTTRRQRVKGRSSDYRDLVNHSKLKKLTKAYIHEYKRHEEEVERRMEDGGDESHVSGGGGGGGGGGRVKKKRRLKNLSKAFYKIVDAGEEMKKRQRMKWRQSAMHLDDDEEDDNDQMMVGGVAAPVAAAGSLDSQIGGRPPPPPSTPCTTNTSISTPTTTTTRTSRLTMETPPPIPPTLPIPDYSTLQTSPHDPGEDIAYQVYIFKCIQSKTQRSIEKTYDGRTSGMYDNFVGTIREYFLLGNITDNLSLMPEYLIMRGKSLKSSLLLVAQWRESRVAYRYGLAGGAVGGAVGSVGYGRGGRAGNGEDQWFGGFCGEVSPQPACSSFKQSLALFLNILACFLYMMNYYIVEPSSTRYANALGSNDAMSGLIIGAMPWAALSSAVVYSIWSNKCYKAPMITSGLLLFAGNIVYATAYRSESITMALCGRFLTGLGGPRSMNRRYIADTTPLAQRTAVNAAFGTATALGAALGPATAIMLDNVNIEFELPLYGTVYLNGMTGPGFLMGCLWIVFTLLIALTFEEPERSGLEEQIRKELLESTTMANAPVMPFGRNTDSPPLSSEYEMSNLDASKNYHVKESKILDSFGCPTQGGREICDVNEKICGSGSISDEQRHSNSNADDGLTNSNRDGEGSIWQQAKFISSQITTPVRICMFLLFSKMFTVESVISAASMVTKNRYGWAVQQVGTLGTIVGCLTIPISVFIGWISQYREDRVLMIWLMSFAALGMGLLIDVTDFVSTETDTYNEGHALAVGPYRYIAGYLLVFCSVQAFDGVVGSVLSKVIPTALATGTLNSGLLATVIGTFGRACGDVFITSVGFIDIRQIMNLLFVPSFIILAFDLILICYKYDSLTA